MRNHKMTTMAGVSLAALLALTACGDDTDADTDAEATDQNGEDAAAEETGDTVFDFGDNTDVSGEEIRIELPEDLAADGRVLDAAVVRAGEDAESDCAIEVSYEYADGVEADIQNNDWEQPTDWEGGDAGVGSPTEWGDVSVKHRHALALGITEGAEIEGNNDADVLSDDLQSAIFPADCATSPADSGEEIQFTALEWSEGTEEETPEDDGIDGPVEDPGTWYDYAEAEVETLATVSVNVSESGEVTVTDSQIH